MFIDNYKADINYIYNKDIKSQFIEDHYAHYKNEAIESVIRLFNTIGISEEQYKKDFSEFNFSEVVNLFETNSWKKMNTFSHNRSILKAYIDWCKTHGKITTDVHPVERIVKEDVIGARKYHKQYFRDFNEFKDCIENVYENAPVEDTKQFVFSKMTFCLYWLGFSKDEIRLMKKTDVNTISKIIVNPVSDYKVENVDDFIIDLAIECINTETYNSKNRNGMTTFNYQKNDYLIRTLVTSRMPDHEPVIEYYFNNILGRFRNISKQIDITNPYYNKSITTESVFLSGAYSKLFNINQKKIFTQNEETYKIISQIGRIDINNQLKLSYFLHDYMAWRKFYYNY